MEGTDDAGLVAGAVEDVAAGSDLTVGELDEFIVGLVTMIKTERKTWDTRLACLLVAKCSVDHEDKGGRRTRQEVPLDDSEGARSVKVYKSGLCAESSDFTSRYHQTRGVCWCGVCSNGLGKIRAVHLCKICRGPRWGMRQRQRTLLNITQLSTGRRDLFYVLLRQKSITTMIVTKGCKMHSISSLCLGQSQRRAALPLSLPWRDLFILGRGELANMLSLWVVEGAGINCYELFDFVAGAGAAVLEVKGRGRKGVKLVFSKSAFELLLRTTKRLSDANLGASPLCNISEVVCGLGRTVV